MMSSLVEPNKDIAQANLEQLPVKVGQWYTHYKGGEYEVIAIALKEDTLEPMVIYRSPEHNNTVWVRAWEDWNADVEYNGNTVKRFVYNMRTSPYHTRRPA